MSQKYDELLANTHGTLEKIEKLKNSRWRRFLAKWHQWRARWFKGKKR